VKTDQSHDKNIFHYGMQSLTLIRLYAEGYPCQLRGQNHLKFHCNFII